MATAPGGKLVEARWIALLALLAGFAALALVPAAARAQACGNARKAHGVRVFGVSCRQGKKVVAESVSRRKCRSSCSFRKVGYSWSCRQRPSGLNACETHVGTKRYTVDWKYTGAKRGARRR